MSLNHSPDLYTAQRLREGGKFACDICGGEFPMSHMRRQSKLHVGAKCCWEPNGGTLERDHRRQFASKMAARKSVKEQQPPKHEGDPYYGVDEVPIAPSFVVTIAPNPIILIRAGSSVSVTLTGNNFSAADTLAYGHAGITDATPPFFFSDTSITLSVHASGGMPVGSYSFTFNGTTWQNVFSVR